MKWIPFFVIEFGMSLVTFPTFLFSGARGKSLWRSRGCFHTSNQLQRRHLYHSYSTFQYMHELVQQVHHLNNLTDIQQIIHPTRNLHMVVLLTWHNRTSCWHLYIIYILLVWSIRIISFSIPQGYQCYSTTDGTINKIYHDL